MLYTILCLVLVMPLLHTSQTEIDSSRVVPVWFKPLISQQDVKVALDKHPGQVNAYNEDGYTGLQRAIITGDFPRAQLFIATGKADINLPVKNDSKQSGNTALHLAIFGVISRNSTDIPLYLIYKGANVNAKNSQGIAPIHHLLWIDSHDQRMEIATHLIKKGADINAQTSQGNTMLHLAVEKYDKKWIQMVRKAFGSALDLEIKNNDGLTPLELAQKLQQFGDDSVVASLTSDYEVLGEGWGGYAKTNKLGQTGLMLAIYRNDQEFAQKMIQKGANINAQDQKGQTPLFYAVESEEPIFFISLLLKKGADVSIVDKQGQTPLMLVVKIKDPEKRIKAARLLLEAGLDENKADMHGDTLWHRATQALDVELIEFLKKKAGTLTKNKKGKTPKDLVRAMKNKRLSKEEQDRILQTMRALESS